MRVFLEENGFSKEGFRRKDGYRKQGPGAFNIQHALKGKPCWWGPTFKKGPQGFKKVLITHSIENNNILDFYEKLLEAGCRLYVWEGKPVLCRTLEKLKTRLKMALPCADDLLDFKKLDYFETTKLRITIDDISMRGLFHCAIDASDFYDGPQEKREALKELLIKEKNIDAVFNIDEPEFDMLVLRDSYKKLRDPNPKKLSKNEITAKQKLKNLKTITFLKNEISDNQMILLKFGCQELEVLSFKKLTGKWDKDLIMKNNPFVKLKALNLGGKNINALQPPDLDFEGSNINATQLEALLLLCPNLESLDLGMCKNLKDFLTVFKESHVRLAKLKSLDLSNTRFNLLELEIWLRLCPKLESLDLTHCGCSGEFSAAFKKDYFYFANLKSLNLTNTWITEAEFKLLLPLFPNLETLILNTPLDAVVHLPKLKSLDLYQSFTISTAQLEGWIRLCPNLEESLNLEDCFCLMEDFSADFKACDPHLARLKKLSLRGSFIQAPQIEALLTQCLDLETLNLSCSNLNLDFYNAFKDQDLNLRNLKSLDLSGTSIGMAELMVLLLQFPNLETLDISDCKNLKTSLPDDCKTILPKFDKLRSLNLANSEMQGKQFEALLLQCPNLELLNMASLDIRDHEDRYKEHFDVLNKGQRRLSKLKSLNMEKVIIDVLAFEALFLQCPNIESLNLSSLKFLGTLQFSNDFEKSNLHYAKLKTLQLQNIHYLYFLITETILRKSPNLESLDLSDSIVFKWDYLLEAIENSQLRLIKLQVLNLSGTKTYPRHLELFLSRSPNLECVNLGRSRRISLEKIQQLKIDWPNCFFMHTLHPKAKISAPSIVPYQPKNGSIPKSIDTDTVFKGDESHTVDQYFLGPRAREYSEYRLKVLASEHSSFKNEITLIPEFKMTKEAKKLQASISGSHYCVPIVINNKWQRLPSLTPYDSEPILQCEVPVELGFNKAEGFYYVRTENSDKNHFLEFVIEESKPQQDFNRVVLKAEIKTDLLRELIFKKDGKLDEKSSSEALKFLRKFNPDEQLMLLRKFFLEFGSGELEDANEDSGFYDKINAFIKHKKGRCRQRAWAFFEIANALGFNVRLIQNDCHAFCEVYIDQKWQTIDLGGFPATLKVNDLTQQGSRGASRHIVEPRTVQLTAQGTTELNSSEPERSLFPDLIKTCPEEINNYSAYAIWIAKQPDTNLLISYQNRAQLDAIVDSMQAGARKSKYSTFYLDNLDEVSYEDFAANQGDYEFTNSPLIQFLKKAKPGDTLIIHREQFKKEHIGYNSMLVDVRKVGQFKIPDGVNIITLIPHSSRLNYGDDFYSRFSFKTEHQKEWPILKPPEINDKKSAEINLYGSEQWQAKTLGKLSFKKEGISYITGKLAKAINEEFTKITFVNPPASREFEVFFRQLQSTRQYFSNGKMHAIPEEVSFHIKNSEYSFGKKDIIFEAPQENNLSNWDVLLNPSALNDFFELHKSESTVPEAKNETNFLDPLSPRSQSAATPQDIPGLLEQHKNKTLRVLLNIDLQPGEWARLIKKAKKYNCQLIAIDVTQTQFDAQERSLANENSQHSIIITNNHDAVAQGLFQVNKEVLVLCVGPETEPSDLLGHMSFERIDRKTLNFPFQEGALIALLKKKKHVVLRGNLSFECESALASLFSNEPHLMVNGERFIPETRISIVSENKSTLNFLPKRTFISGSSAFTEDTVIRPKLAEITSELTEDPERFDRERLTKITDVLKTEPGVFVVGPTAAGKSTLIAKKLFKEKSVKGYTGLEQIKAFASDNSPGLKILLIDEANLLEPSLLTRLEGIFSPSPGILIDEIWYPLTQEHKVIFVGNPPDYKNRTSHPLWERYLKSLSIESLPFWYIKQRVILPLCEKLGFIVDDTFLNEIESNANLTPRDIQQKLFRLKFPEKNLELEVLKKILLNLDFTVTKSRAPALKNLLQHLEIREHKKSEIIEPIIQNQESVESLQNQGQNACILEGDAGVGKSVMAEALLKSQGFKPGDLEKPDLREKIYYYISSSDLQDLNKILKKAFYEGAALIIDELNAFPSDVERDLNTYLSGTDLENNPPKIPGFFIIGTQNPVKSASSGIENTGRQEESIAFENRCHKICLPSYNDSELTELLCARGYEENFSSRFASDFLRAQKKAIATNALVIPTPRDYFNLSGQKTENILAFMLFTAIQNYIAKPDSFGRQFAEILGLLEKGANPNLIIEKGESCQSLLKKKFLKNSAAQEIVLFCLIHSKEISKAYLGFYRENSGLLKKAYWNSQSSLGPTNRVLFVAKKKDSVLDSIIDDQAPKSTEILNAKPSSRFSFFPKVSQKQQDTREKGPSILRK